jgi:tetratricopeptide (TPR) repeat protein
MQRADVLNFGGEQTDALLTINQSLSVFEGADLFEWYADALRVRGTISLAIGDYVGARQDLLRALTHYEEANQIIHRLQCHVRIAMLCFVLGDMPGALLHLERGIQFIHVAGGYKYMLSVFDIFSGVLRAYGDKANALNLWERTDVLRKEWHLYRSAVLDQLIDLHRLHKTPPTPHHFAPDVFAASQTVQDIATVVMQCIYVLREGTHKQITRV